MQRRNWSLRVILLVIPGVLAVALAANAGAFTVDDYVASNPNREIRYFMDDTAITNGLGSGAPGAIRAGDQAWKVHDLAAWLKFTHDNNSPDKVVAAADLGEPGGVLADAGPVGGCPYSGTCLIRFDTSENWYTGTGTPGNGQVDLRASAAHEFGHWLGMRHSGGATGCPAPDRLESDGNALPTMAACQGGLSTERRTIAQDDMNGFHVARQGSPLPTSNDSFEYTSPAYGWGYSPRGGGGVSRICDGTSYHRSCRVQDTGVNTSIYQDIVSRGGELSSHGLYARAWMRSSSGASISATVAVWNLSTGAVVIQKTCTIGTTWSECRTGTFSHTNGTKLRVEVYNNTGTHLNHDLVSLRW